MTAQHPTIRATVADAQLAQQAGHGDSEALHLLIDRHAPAVRAWLKSRVLGDEDDFLIDGIIDDIFGRPRHFAAFGRRDGSASLRTYLCAIARHMLAAHRKRVCREKSAFGAIASLDFDGQSEAASIANFDLAFDAIDAADAVAQMQHTLDAIDRAICEGISFGRSMDEIARQIGSTPNAVTVRWHRLRHELRRRFAHFAELLCRPRRA